MRGLWEYDPKEQLGNDGGFGAVYAGRAADGRHVAVKRLHGDSLASTPREVEVAKSFIGRVCPHVIGILDAGRDASGSAFYLVMERAQQSLQKLIDETDYPGVPFTDALRIVDAIAAGLEEIGELVHRDLKPANVLLHNGVWKLADLGTSRFINEATATKTMRGFFTFPYCSPEQLRMDRTSKATDVYALGAIIYALLTGKPPFSGPTEEDYAQQHQYEPPPQLGTFPPVIQQVALSCLAKIPSNRPSLRELRNQVQRILSPLGIPTTFPPLADAVHVLAERNSRLEARAVSNQKAFVDRKTQSDEAIQKLRDLLARLAYTIKEQASSARMHQEVYTRSDTKIEETRVRFGAGKLTWRINLRCEPIVQDIKWDVLASGYIEVALEVFCAGTAGRSANLLFGKLDDDEGYHWWEVAVVPAQTTTDDLFRVGVVNTNIVPFGLQEVDENPYPLLELLIGNPKRLMLFGNPKPIDGSFEQMFVERWLDWFARAAIFQDQGVDMATGQDRSPFHPPAPAACPDDRLFPVCNYDEIADYPVIDS